jgi:C4-dicarboxylate-specific signal transduction histidine kinase
MSLRSLAVAASMVPLAASCATTGSTFRSGVGDAHLLVGCGLVGPRPHAVAHDEHLASRLARDRQALDRILSNLVSNAIEHGHPSPEGTIRMAVAEEDGALVFEVEDHGTFVPKAQAVDPFPERGRGLAFMAAVVDEVDVRHGERGTVVRLCKRRAVLR